MHVPLSNQFLSAIHDERAVGAISHKDRKNRSNTSQRKRKIEVLDQQAAVQLLFVTDSFVATFLELTFLKSASDFVLGGTGDPIDRKGMGCYHT